MYQTTAWPAVSTSASSTIFRLPQRAKDSESGALEVLPSDFILMKAGDSFIDSRIHTEIPSSTTEIRNGTRQPQSAKASSPIAVRVPRITISDRNRPSVAVVWIHAVKAPRLLLRRVLGDIGGGTAVFAAQAPGPAGCAA